MTYYIDLNSGYRDRIDNPNPFHYVVSSRQMDTWFQKLKFKDHCILEMTLEHVILPYQGFLLDQPKLYLDIYFYGPLPFRRNIEMIDDHLRRAKFSLIKDKVVHGSSGAPAWIHYKSTNVQKLIYTRDFPLKVEFFDVTGATCYGSDPIYEDDSKIVEAGDGELQVLLNRDSKLGEDDSESRNLFDQYQDRIIEALRLFDEQMSRGAPIPKQELANSCMVNWTYPGLVNIDPSSVTFIKPVLPICITANEYKWGTEQPKDKFKASNGIVIRCNNRYAPGFENGKSNTLYLDNTVPDREWLPSGLRAYIDKMDRVQYAIQEFKDAAAGKPKADQITNLVGQLQTSGFTTDQITRILELTRGQSRSS